MHIHKRGEEMISKVMLKSSPDGSTAGIIEVETIYDDMEIHLQGKMTVKRGYGYGSCTNEDGTDGKIEVYGDFTFVEKADGSMALSPFSQESIDDAVAVFRLMFGEHEQTGE